MEIIQIKMELYKIAWSQLGLPAGPKVRSYIKSFLKSPQYLKGYQKYWEQNPVLERMGFSDDMQTQKFVVYLTQEFTGFIVSKLDFETPEPLERSNEGELTV